METTAVLTIKTIEGKKNVIPFKWNLLNLLDDISRFKKKNEIVNT